MALCRGLECSGMQMHFRAGFRDMQRLAKRFSPPHSAAVVLDVRKLFADSTGIF